MADKYEKGPLVFIKATLEDKALAEKVHEAIERGGMVTAKAVMEIAEREGYSFSREEFQEAVLKEYRKKFEAGDTSFEVFFGPNAATNAPESSCQKGCISWTYNNYHPGHDLTS
ncbi:Nif11-like leader peptide family natural product precursor [Roseovarius sp. Pro17]|uniref:Nif11-like leader peptide family natural product precursor n=1 Tax=Roseovarius sp. Pro17 TaxID=3108175 RepID=UPI002D773770|nr:Nif11-like leader peptide family natural product precursor [Roseovarius sp. Pro17]